MKTDETVYKSIIPVLKSLSEEKLPAVSILANTAALLYDSFEKISWAGFYLLEGETLYVGPFQGKSACTKIDRNKGVCGKAARDKVTVIVEDVDLFPGHIACDSESKSEIVVPVILDDTLIGVLDIDSRSYSSFGSKDKKYLEEITSIIVKNRSFSGFKIL